MVNKFKILGYSKVIKIGENIFAFGKYNTIRVFGGGKNLSLQEYISSKFGKVSEIIWWKEYECEGIFHILCRYLDIHYTHMFDVIIVGDCVLQYDKIYYMDEQCIVYGKYYEETVNIICKVFGEISNRVIQFDMFSDSRYTNISYNRLNNTNIFYGKPLHGSVPVLDFDECVAYKKNEKWLKIMKE